MDKLPIYNAVIEDESEGILIMSLVDEPATETNWVCFNKDTKQCFSIVNEEEHILAGVAMIADTPIYRRDESGYEYYIQYSKETIKQMAEKMLADGTFNNIDIQHNEQILDKGKVNLVELFIKDSSKGIAPNYLDVPEGSLLANYKIHDEELWEAAKSGKLNGFSLAGIFSTKINKFRNMSFKEALKKLLAEFGSVKTDKAILVYDGEELIEGIEVMQENGEAIPDGEYVADEKIIEVVEGKVASIKPKEAEKEEVEEPVAESVEAEEVVEEPVAEPVEEATVIDYQPQIDALNEKIAILEEKISEILNKPVAEPVEENFNKVNPQKTRNKATEYASAIKK